MKTNRLSILALILMLSQLAQGQGSKSNEINPTGIYKMKGGNVKKKGGEVYGYTGELRVIKIDSSRIAVSLYVNKGYPSYNSGSFIDTLAYSGNKAMYKTEIDTTCKITFFFTSKGAKVDEEAEDYNFGCGFGHAVVATGFYRKITSQIPVLGSKSE